MGLRKIQNYRWMNAKNRGRKSRTIIKKQKVIDFLRKMKILFDLVINFEDCDMTYLLYPVGALILTIILWRVIAIISRRLFSTQAVSNSTLYNRKVLDNLDDHIQGIINNKLLKEQRDKNGDVDLTFTKLRRNLKGIN